MAKLFANSGDPDQTPHSAASELGLHCLPITFLRVQWVKVKITKLNLWPLIRCCQNNGNLSDYLHESHVQKQCYSQFQALVTITWFLSCWTRICPVFAISVATFFRGDWSWNIFYGHSLPSADSRRAVVSCQFLAKECAQYWLTA